MCQLCHDNEETIQHILSSCPALATTKYLDRHNMIGQVLHWHLCKFFKLSTSANSWYEHHPLPVTENGDAKLLWDFGLITDNHVASNWPDVVLFHKQESRIIFLEISCPADINFLNKEQEKLTKYQPLVREISYCYDQPVDIIPLVFGHSGVVSYNQLSHLKRISNYNEVLFNNLQKAALLGTIDILRSVNIGYT